jgi:flap endonuclease-1
MGIKGLGKFLKEHAPSGVKEINVEKLRNKILNIDASQTIYQFVMAVRTSGKDMVDSDGNMTTHLHAMLYKTLTMLDKGIKPIFVFDGKANELKEKLLNKRKADKIKAQGKTKKHEKDHSAFKASFKIESWMVDECKEFLDLLGVPYVHAIEEADSECAEMTRDDTADYANSEDLDLLTFGCTDVVTTIKQNSKTVTKYNLENILDELDLEYEEFVDLCILFGCDYCPTIKGIGHVKAFALITKYKSISNIINAVNKKKIKNVEISKEFEITYKKARNYFINPPITDEYELKWKSPNIKGIVKYLKKRDFDLNTLKTRLTKLWKLYCDIFCSSQIKKKIINIDIFKGIDIPDKNSEIQLNNDSDDST